MRNKWLVLALIVTATVGGGCWNKQQTSDSKQQETVSSNPLPTLDILSPGLSSTTKSEKIQIIGTTNRDYVWIADKRMDVKEGKFEQAYDLQPGLNAIPVSVNNGVATTTITLNVTRETPTPATGKTTAPTTQKPSIKTTVTAKTPTAPAKTDANPTATQLKVDFVSGEMALTASMEPRGATLSWGRAADPFQSYVIVKSTVDPAPYFPKQFWVKAINDIDVRTWLDTTAEAHKTTYYRVCKIKPDQSVACGNVAKIVKP